MRCREHRSRSAVVAIAAALAACSEPKPQPQAAAPAHATSEPASAVDPLPSWRESSAKRTLLGFVAAVEQAAIPPEARIAVFDNDGTLWAEKPVPFELMFALDRVIELAPNHPAWKREQPFVSVLAHDHEAVMAQGRDGLAKIIAVTHSGMTTEEFDQQVKAWIARAQHPSGRRYGELVYQPMLELLELLRARGFTPYIVSGGDVGFMRAIAEDLYGIPPEQVIGSEPALELARRRGIDVLLRAPEHHSITLGGTKPIAIDRRIGRRPILAFGNSDGDLEMLAWTVGGTGPSLALLLHHTDAAREYAYDRDDTANTLDEALDEAARSGWTVVDMARDWGPVFAYEAAE